MSIREKFYIEYTTLTSVNERKTFPQPIYLNKNSREVMLRWKYATFSTSLVNIFPTTGSNLATNLVRYSLDGSTWTNITIPTGNYSVSELNNFFQQELSSHYIDSTNPGFLLYVNSVVKKCYIIIDSTKFTAASQFCIDFSQSLIYNVLGCVDTKTFITEGYHAFSDIPKINYWGDSLNLILDIGSGPLSTINGVMSKRLLTIPFINDDERNIYYVENTINSVIPVSIPNPFTTYNIKYVDNNNNEVLINGGEASLEFELF